MTERSVGIFGKDDAGVRQQAKVNSDGELLTASSGGGSSGNADSILDKVKSSNYYSTFMRENDLSIGESRYFYLETPDDTTKNFYLTRFTVTSSKGVKISINQGGELTPAYLAGSANADDLINHNLKSSNTSGILINGLTFAITISDFVSLDPGDQIFRIDKYIGDRGSPDNQRLGDELIYDTPILLANNTRYAIQVVGDNVISSGFALLRPEFYVEDLA